MIITGSKAGQNQAKKEYITGAFGTKLAIVFRMRNQPEQADRQIDDKPDPVKWAQ